MTKEKTNKILQLYAQGVSIESASQAIIKEQIDMIELLKHVEKYELGNRWKTIKEVRALVMKTANEALAEYDPQTLHLSLAGQQITPKAEEGLLKEYEDRIIKQESKAFYKVALIQHLYLQTGENIAKCAENCGMTEKQYYIYLGSHASLAEAHEQAIERREQIYLPKFQADKLELLDMVVENLKEQNQKDGFQVFELIEKEETNEVTDEDGEVIGYKTKKTTDTKQKQVKASAAIMRLTLDMVGITREEEKLIPETVVKLERVSKKELDKRRKELKDRIAKIRAENPDAKPSETTIE